MTRQIWLPALVLAVGLLAASSEIAAAQSADSSPATVTSSSAPSGQLLQYSLPPDKLGKAYALYLVNGVLYFVGGIWSVLVLWMMLRARFGVHLRTWAERASRRRFVQAVIVMSLFVLVMELAQLPFDMYG